MFDIGQWSNFLQNPQDLTKIANPSAIPVVKPNTSMSAPQIQGGINAPMQQPRPPMQMDPAQMMSLMGRFGMPQQSQQQPQMPPAQMPQAQAPTGTFSGLSPYMPKPAAPAAPVTAAPGKIAPTYDNILKYGIGILYPQEGSMG